MFTCAPALFASSGGAGPPSWHIALSLAADSGPNTGWNGYTVRHRLGQSRLGGACSKIRVYGYASTTAVIDKCYVQEAAATGNVYDFSTTPVQILWSGSASHTFANLVLEVSDDTSLTISGTRDVIISLHFSGSSNMRGWTDIPSGSGAYYKLGDEAATVAASAGYSTTTGFFFPKIEVYR